MKPFLWQDIKLHGVLESINMILYLTQVVSEFKIRVRKITFLLEYTEYISVHVITGERKSMFCRGRRTANAWKNLRQAKRGTITANIEFL
jgi:hypothetical protein